MIPIPIIYLITVIFYLKKFKKTTAKSDMEEEKAGWKSDEASKW